MQGLVKRIAFHTKAAKTPTIAELTEEWNECCDRYSTFDITPQTFFFSLANILQLESAKNVLEVACGTGKLLPYALERKGAETAYLASDLAPNMVTLAQSNLRRHFERYQSKLTFEDWCKAQRINFSVINAEEPFVHAPFDRIICNCALMLTENPVKMMKNLASLAQPGCLFGLSVWGDRLQNNLLMAMMESIVDSGYSIPEERSKFHLYKQVGALAEQTGWEVVLNWEQNTLYPFLEYSPDKNTELFHFQLDKLPKDMRQKGKASLERRLTKMFEEKRGANFACELYVLRRK